MILKDCVCEKPGILKENEEGIIICQTCNGYRGKATFYGSCREQMEMMLKQHNDNVK